LAIYTGGDYKVNGIVFTKVVVGSADGIFSEIIVRGILISLENIWFGSRDFS